MESGKARSRRAGKHVLLCGRWHAPRLEMPGSQTRNCSGELTGHWAGTRKVAVGALARGGCLPPVLQLAAMGKHSKDKKDKVCNEVARKEIMLPVVV